MEIYADVLFVLNFSMNYVSLYLAGKLTHDRTNILRISIASAVGGIFGVIVSILDIAGIPLLILEIVGAVVMSAITYGVVSLGHLMIDSVAVFAIASLIGGIMTVGENIAFPASGSKLRLCEVIPLAISAVAVLYFAILVLCKCKNVAEVIVTAELNGKRSSFSALVDSGNLVVDPISARPAILASVDVLVDMLGDHCGDLVNGMSEAVFESELASRIRCVRVNSHGDSKLEYGIIPDKVTVDSNGKKRLVDAVIIPEKRSRDAYGGFSATCPSSLI